MKVLAHRGFWQSPEEKNTLLAFKRAFALGVGVETDLRDHAGRIFISHDPPLGDELPLEAFLDAWAVGGLRVPLALNIKSDGLEAELLRVLQFYEDPEYFVFDMSLPSTLGYRWNAMPYFSRQSEFEPQPLLYDEAAGVWVDCFLDIWYDEPLLAGHLASGKQVCLVSPELHRRDHRAFWEQLRGMKILHNPKLMLCTDFPQEALEYFNG